MKNRHLIKELRKHNWIQLLNTYDKYCKDNEPHRSRDYFLLCIKGTNYLFNIRVVLLFRRFHLIIYYNENIVKITRDPVLISLFKKLERRLYIEHLRLIIKDKGLRKRYVNEFIERRSNEEKTS